MNCGDRGVRVDRGHGVVDCGNRELLVDRGHRVVDIQGRGTFVSSHGGTSINHWGRELVKKLSTIKLYQSKKHGNQSLDETMSKITVELELLKAVRNLSFVVVAVHTFMLG